MPRVNAYAGYAPDLTTLLAPRRASLLGDRGPAAATADERGAAGTGPYPAELISHALRPGRPDTARRELDLPAAGLHDPANAHRRYPVAYLIHGWPGSS